MERYYLYITKSYLRVYTLKSKGKPMEFIDSDNNAITDIPNLIKYDFDSNEFKIVLKPDIFRQTFLSPFNNSSNALGYNNHFLLYFFFLDLFTNYIKNKEFEVVVIPTMDLLLSLTMKDEETVKDYFELPFELLKDKGFKISYKGSYVNRLLKENILCLIGQEYKTDALFYMDDEVYTHMYSRNNNILYTTSNWKHLEKEEDDFNECRDSLFSDLKNEGIDLNDAIKDDLIDHLIDSSFLDENSRVETIMSKDRLYSINNKKIRDKVRSLIDKIIENIKKDIVDEKLDGLDNTYYILNVSNKYVENHFIDYFKSIKSKELELYSFDDITYKMLLYTDMVIKYNAPLYKKNISRKEIKGDDFFQEINYNIMAYLDAKDKVEVLEHLSFDPSLFKGTNLNIDSYLKAKDLKKKKRK